MPTDPTNTPEQDRPPYVNTSPSAPHLVNPSGQTSAEQTTKVVYEGTAPIAQSGRPADVKPGIRRP